ncbi:efflux RND transporter periplasmic adaptor subunit [Thalassococcus sp. BH17M4-6]|uniref:efflux RND transporter periplasmic adaptor subunit n=1 Tax=Thalassococcus sp. BH17M4-6 TaxID=3413148 RepID=UPI003BE9BE15
MKPVLALATLCIALAGAVCAQEDAAPKPVKLITLSPQQNAIEREFFGQVVARQTVDLAFQVAGQIVELPVKEGARLSEGDLIAQLDLEPFQLRLDQARLEKEQADRRLERQQALSSAAVSEAAIEDAQTAANLADIAVRDAQRALDLAELTAPFDALVATRNVANFSTVSAGSPVVRLHDMSETRIEIEVPELLFRRAQDPDAVELLASFPGRDERLPLEIREFQAETSAVGQTYTATLAVQGAVDPTIIPGASATVVARQPVSDQVVTLPASAVVIAPDRSTSVMVFEPVGADSGTVRQMPVELQTLENGMLALTQPPDSAIEVVAAGASRLEDGQAVRRFTGFGN